MSGAKKQPPKDVSIGRFDILATYAYAEALLDGVDEGEAKRRDMVAAVMGAKARLGHIGGSRTDDYKAQKDAAEKKNKDDDHRRVVRPSGRRQDGRVLRRRVPADQ